MSLQRKSILERPWLQEVLIFATLFILYTLTEWREAPRVDQFWEASGYFLLLFSHAQLHRLFLLPILLEKQKPLSYALLSILLLLFFSAVIFLVSIFAFRCDYLTRFGPAKSIVYHVAGCTVSLIGMIAPYILLRFYREQKRVATTQLCWNQMELSLLRSQLNPHFMFNTFNNLYGVSLQEPTRLPDLILQVSQLMRYQLENQSKWWVSLKDELAFIESYIALEEERVGRRCDIRYEYRNEGPDTHDQIAPMTLIPFIENAFKHGANSIESCFVHIRITVKDSWLEMDIENSIPKSMDVSQVSTGIGLQNAQQRLNIIYPGKKHRLDMHTTRTEYKVSLALRLNPKDHDGKVYLPHCG